MTNAVSMMPENELDALHLRDGESGLGALQTEQGTLPLKQVKATIDVEGLIATTTIEQTFVNPFSSALEATYIFPLPDRSAVHRFTLAVGDRVISGVLRERGAAREAYRAAVDHGQRAAIAEEERPGVFSLRVGNIGPRERADVRLELVGAVPVEACEATVRVPLVVAPRYIPGVPLEGDDVGDGIARDTDEVPDASRISPPVLLPGFPDPVRLKLQVRIEPRGLSFGAPRASLPATITEQGEGSKIVEVQPGARLSRDFILRFSIGDRDLTTSVCLKPDSNDARVGTFCLTAVPPQPDDTVVRAGRDVVLLLDRSGSMGGWKMVAARRAAARIVDALDVNDRFAVLGFDDQIVRPPSLPHGLVEARDRARFRAVEFLAGLEARGGTVMKRPLVEATELLTEGHLQRQRVVVLVTDGQVGNEAQILRALAPKLSGTRIFAVGIDRAVNQGFLRQLAELGGGKAELIESEDRLDEVMRRIQRQIGRPLLLEPTLAATGATLSELAPAWIPDLYADAPTTLYGRYRLNDGYSSVAGFAINGHRTDGAKQKIDVPVTTSTSSAVGPLWARARLRSLEDQYSIRPSPDLEQTIVATSLAHDVLCRFTAFVAIDESSTGREPIDPLHRVMVPVEAPDGWVQAAMAPPPNSAPGAIGGVLDYALASFGRESGAAFEASVAGSATRTKSSLSGLLESVMPRRRVVPHRPARKAAETGRARSLTPADVAPEPSLPAEIEGRPPEDLKEIREWVAWHLHNEGSISVEMIDTLAERLRQILSRHKRLSEAQALVQAWRGAFLRRETASVHLKAIVDLIDEVLRSSPPPRRRLFWK